MLPSAAYLQPMQIEAASPATPFLIALERVGLCRETGLQVRDLRFVDPTFRNQAPLRAHAPARPTAQPALSVPSGAAPAGAAADRARATRRRGRVAGAREGHRDRQPSAPIRYAAAGVRAHTVPPSKQASPRARARARRRPRGLRRGAAGRRVRRFLPKLTNQLDPKANEALDEEQFLNFGCAARSAPRAPRRRSRRPRRGGAGTATRRPQAAIFLDPRAGALARPRFVFPAVAFFLAALPHLEAGTTHPTSFGCAGAGRRLRLRRRSLQRMGGQLCWTRVAPGLARRESLEPCYDVLPRILYKAWPKGLTI